MHSKKLAKLQTELEQLRSNPIGIKPKSLVRIAKRLGRTRKPGFTNEPTYVRTIDPAFSPPLSIPNHPTLKPGTARSIIAALLDDVDTWKIFLQQQVGGYEGTEEDDDDYDNDDDSSDD